MKEKVSLQGRSLIFNIGFVVLNLSGLTLLVMGYHKSFEEQKMLFVTLALVLMIASIAGIILFKGRMLMSGVSRVMVGGLFIVSGLVKANDPIGFSYKLEEYFEDGALAFRIKEWFGAPGFSMEALIPYALTLSIVICVAEIILGVMTIIGGKIKLTTYLMLFMMIFFTFLTWHTANCDASIKFVDRDTYEMSDPLAQLKIDEATTNKDLKIVSKTKNTLIVDEKKQPQCVSDCGCFGDAMKGSVGRSLTPGESLWKDIVLLYLVIWIFIAQWKIKPNTRKENMVFVPASLLVIVFFSWVFGWYFPVWFGLLCILSALWLLNLKRKWMSNHWMAALLIAFWCILLESYVLMYEPLKDYRPYAVGANLRDNMNDGITGQFEYFYFLTDLETNKTSRVPMSEIKPEMWSETTKWKTEFDTTECVVEPKNPSIMDFNPMISISDMTKVEWDLLFIKNIVDTSQVKVLKILSLEYDSMMDTPIDEYTPEDFPADEYEIKDTVVQLNPALTDFAIKDAILEQNKIVMLISRKLLDANWSAIEEIKEIYEQCKQNNVPFIVICNASRDDINDFRDKNDFEVPVFIMDEIELKVISRSNPALLVLEKATVTAKFAHRSIPSGEVFKSKYLK